MSKLMWTVLYEFWCSFGHDILPFDSSTVPILFLFTSRLSLLSFSFSHAIASFMPSKVYFSSSTQSMSASKLMNQYLKSSNGCDDNHRNWFNDVSVESQLQKGLDTFFFNCESTVHLAIVFEEQFTPRSAAI